MFDTFTPVPSLLAVGLLLGAGCAPDEPAEAASSEASAPATPSPAAPHDTAADDTAAVDTDAAGPDQLRVTGTAEAVRTANVAASMSATVTSLAVAEGEHVTDGQPLVRLDARAARATAAQARAGAAAAQVQASQAAADLDRLGPLAERGAIPSSRLTLLETQRDASRAQSTAARAAASAASAMARNAVVRAPFDGVVVDLPLEVGEMATMMPATTVARVVDLSALVVRARVHERAFGSISVGDHVPTRFPSLGRTAVGRVTRIGREISAQSRTFEVVVELDNADESLPAGLFAELTFDLTPDATAAAATRPETPTEPRDTAVLASAELQAEEGVAR